MTITLRQIRTAVAKLKAKEADGDVVLPIRNWPLFADLRAAGCMGQMPDGSWTYNPEPRTWLLGKPVGAP